jgi:hypothetical protein
MLIIASSTVRRFAHHLPLILYTNQLDKENDVELRWANRRGFTPKGSRKIVTRYDISVFEEKISNCSGMRLEFPCIFNKAFIKKPHPVCLVNTLVD